MQIRLLPDCEAVPFALMSEPQIAPRPEESIYMGASVVMPKPVAIPALHAVAGGLLALRQAFMPKVLTVDDDEMLGKFVKSVLEPEGIVIEYLGEAIKIREALAQFAPDVVLLDVMMPSISGYDVCRLIKDDSRWAPTRVIFITSKSGPEGKELAFTAGGNDFLPKPIVSAELINRVKAQLAQSPSAIERLERDSLTGLMQPRPFETAVTALVASATQKHSVLSMVVIEVVHLREICANFGLSAGQKLLSELGHLVQGRLRAEDIRARLGDFIVILLIGQSTEMSEDTLQLLASEFSQNSFSAPDGTDLPSDLNYGIAELWKDGNDAGALIQAASTKLLRKHAVK
jgi:diguanylate cyclase (GGDEF)-like protein